MNAFIANPKPTPIHVALRGIAACWVVVAHLCFNPIYDAGFAQAGDFGFLAPLIRFDFLAVDFFFVLSGCLLALQYRSIFESPHSTSAQMDRFYLLRLARVYPLHLLTLIMIFVTAYAGIDWPHHAGQWQTLWQHRELTGIANLALVHAWGILPGSTWNEPAWTVSILALLYVCFPNIIYIGRRVPDRARVSLTLIAVLLSAYALQRHFYPLGAHTDGAGGIIRGSVFFLCGILVARLHQCGWASQWPWHRLFYLLLGSGIGAVYLWWQQPFDMLVLHALYPLLMLAALRANGNSMRWLQGRVFGWLGLHAFAIYMLHYPMLVLTKYYLSDSLHALASSGVFGRAAAYALVLGLLLTAAYLAQRFIEGPVQRYAKRRFGMSRP